MAPKRKNEEEVKDDEEINIEVETEESDHEKISDIDEERRKKMEEKKLENIKHVEELEKKFTEKLTVDDLVKILINRGCKEHNPILRSGAMDLNARLKGRRPQSEFRGGFRGRGSFRGRSEYNGREDDTRGRHYSGPPSGN